MNRIVVARCVFDHAQSIDCKGSFGTKRVCIITVLVMRI